MFWFWNKGQGSASVAAKTVLCPGSPWLRCMHKLYSKYWFTQCCHYIHELDGCLPSLCPCINQSLASSPMTAIQGGRRFLHISLLSCQVLWSWVIAWPTASPVASSLLLMKLPSCITKSDLPVKADSLSSVPEDSPWGCFISSQIWNMRLQYGIKNVQRNPTACLNILSLSQDRTPVISNQKLAHLPIHF